jgi:hypothetical protein
MTPRSYKQISNHAFCPNTDDVTTRSYKQMTKAEKEATDLEAQVARMNEETLSQQNEDEEDGEDAFGSGAGAARKTSFQRGAQRAASSSIAISKEEKVRGCRVWIGFCTRGVL